MCSQAERRCDCPPNSSKRPSAFEGHFSEYHNDEEDDSDNSSVEDEDDEHNGESDTAKFLHNRDGSDGCASSAEE